MKPEKCFIASVICMWLSCTGTLMAGDPPGVAIGDQVWMRTNLNEEVPGSWCYNENPELCKIYGRLYTWEAASKACPAGWRLPTASEWDQLVETLERTNQVGRELKKTGSNHFGARFAGDYHHRHGYRNLGYSTHFWTADLLEGGLIAKTRSLMLNHNLVGKDYFPVTNRFSVRCILD